MTEIPGDQPVASTGPTPGLSIRDGDRSAPSSTPPAPAAAAPSDAPTAESDALQARRGCTAAQLRRFIKSRPYVPLHELRRRFELAGEADDLSPLETENGVAYVGLPERESGLLQELLRQGEIGVELCVDPHVAVVVGVFPMRPVPRA